MSNHTFSRGNFSTRAMFYSVLGAVESDCILTASYECIGLGQQEEWFLGNPSKIRMQEIA